MKPSDFTVIHPSMSVFGKTEYESVAFDVMRFLETHGNEFREVDEEEFLLWVNRYGPSSIGYFKVVKAHCESEEMAKEFSPSWRNITSTRKLDQRVFRGKPCNIAVACVDLNGDLKFGTDGNVKYSWYSNAWVGQDWMIETSDTSFEPMTMITRDKHLSE